MQGTAKEKHKVITSGTLSSKWCMNISYTALGFSFMIITTFFQLIINNGHQPAAVSGFIHIWLWPILGISVFFGTLLAGNSHPAHATRYMAWAFIAQAIGIVILLITTNIFALILSCILFGAPYMLIAMLTLSEAKSRYSDVRMISVLTVTNALGQVVGPIIAGFIHNETGSFTMTLVLAAIALIIGAFFIITEKTIWNKSILSK
jgi:predicted cobalt transporter CbtA